VDVQLEAEGLSVVAVCPLFPTIEFSNTQRTIAKSFIVLAAKSVSLEFEQKWIFPVEWRMFHYVRLSTSAPKVCK